MKRVRVLLADLPKLLRTILLARLEAEEGVDLICWTGEDRTLSEAIREHRPDVLITDGNRSELIGALQSIVDVAPGLKLLAVSANGRQAFLYDLSPSRHELGEPTPTSLIRTVLDVRGKDSGESAL